MAGLSFPGRLALDCQVQLSVAVYVTLPRGRPPRNAGRGQDATGTRATLRPMRSEPQPPVTEALPQTAVPKLSRFVGGETGKGGVFKESRRPAGPDGRLCLQRTGAQQNNTLRHGSNIIDAQRGRLSSDCGRAFSEACHPGTAFAGTAATGKLRATRSQ